LGKFTLIFQVKIDNRYKESYWLPRRRYKTRCICHIVEKIELDQKDIDLLECDFKVGV